jgi:rifampicin phosphotransferase
MNRFILPLSDLQANLETVGGKGASLAKMARAGFNVPDGFHVTTEAYRDFVAANGLQAHILKALEATDIAVPATLEEAAQTIDLMFGKSTMPDEILQAVRTAYTSLGAGRPCPVAVRSSATAEDLPEASFAGQQETYLNINSTEAVLDSVQRCWASLWTARAIAYRMRQGIPHENVALAVVVQLLVPAEAAGILFTANPLNGNRNETVINAAWGLGEAIVGGLVTPDLIVVDRLTNRVLQRETAEKLVMTVRSEPGAEEQAVPEKLKKKAVLNDHQAIELRRIGVQVEGLYGTPMDIEWALLDDRFVLLQARPITTMSEAPLEWKLPRAKGIYMRSSVVDLMPDPLSPLFASLGVQTLAAQMYPLGRYLVHSEPVLPSDYYTTINGYAYMGSSFSLRGWLWILFGLLPATLRLMNGSAVSFWRDEVLPRYKALVAQKKKLELENLNIEELWQLAREIMDEIGYYTDTLLFATMGASAGSEGLLTKLYAKMVQRPGEVPGNVLLMGWDSLPIRSEKSLFDLAGFCRDKPSLCAYILDTPAPDLVKQYTKGEDPAGIEVAEWDEFCQRFEIHLRDFGQMIFELDFAKPLPLDHPEPMIEAIKMYLRGEGADPYQRQKASEQRRIQTAETALGRLKGIRRWIFVKALNWGQSLAAVREDALAEIGLGYPLLRQALHAMGEQLKESNVVNEADDIYWLEKDEIEGVLVALAAGSALESLSAKIEQRKAFWTKAKAATPPPMLPPRKRFLGIKTSLWLPEVEGSQLGNSLKGVPASPGRVTATACVLRGMDDFANMRPGAVLVASTTTPAWTPLFSMAAAVVTDIGGPLSHGSIVAREYGIPAVMGTGAATRRIRDGQKITVDGNVGIVTLNE